MESKNYTEYLNLKLEELSEFLQEFVLKMTDAQLIEITPSPKYSSKVYLARIKSQYYIDSSFE